MDDGRDDGDDDQEVDQATGHMEDDKAENPSDEEQESEA
jgi:hypothetical protein